MTDEIIELMNQRRNENDQRAVKELTKTIRRKCREAKDEEIEQKCREVEDLENRNETMKMYQLVRQLAPKEKPKQNKAIADKNGSLLCEKDKINKRWKEYVEELYDSKLERPEFKTTENDEISLVEIFNAARGISNKKSPGSDGIPIEFLKYGGNRTLSQVCQLIHRIYQQEEEIPEEWFESIFVEIPKKSGTKKCEEHRTIALIPHAMKILCKTMYNRISIKINRQLDPLQFGFRPKVGTVESMTALKTILNNRINHGKSTYLCFIDFTKAFDRVEHKMLIDVLKKKGVKQAEILLICEIYNKQRSFMRNDSE